MRRRLVARAVLLAFALLAAAVIPAHATPSPPRLLRYDDTSKFAVRPPTLAFGADGGVLVLGPNVTKSDFRAHHDGHIRWKYWNRTDGASGVPPPLPGPIRTTWCSCSGAAARTGRTPAGVRARRRRNAPCFLT